MAKLNNKNNKKICLQRKKFGKIDPWSQFHQHLKSIFLFCTTFLCLKFVCVF